MMENTGLVVLLGHVRLNMPSLSLKVLHGVGGGPSIGLCQSTGSHSMCVNSVLFCVGM